MKIYADMLFAINFSMDFIALFITTVFLKRKVHKKRILIAAVIGGFYGVFEVLVSLNTVISVAVSILVSFLICFIAYFEKSIKRFIGMYLVYWGVSACLGGFMSILYSFLNKLLAEYLENYTYSKVYTGARFFIIAALAIIISMIFGRFFTFEKAIDSVTLDITVNDKRFSVNALCDSGNLLNEPLSGKSVILISDNTELGKIISEMPDIKKRYIPYEGVGGGGLLKGIIPKAIKINNVETVAIVAPIEKKDFGGYEACVPMSLAKRR